MNGLNESDVTKVTCVTNVTCETNVTNKFDETRFLSFMQSGASRHLRGRIAFQTDISTCYSAPSQKTERKSAKRGCVKMHILLHPRRCVRMAKMQGAEDEGAGSVLKYMTKPESDSNEADWLL